MPERYAAQANDFFTQTVARVYPYYEKKLRDSNAVDFDDLLLIPALALKHDAELRSELDARFQFVLIDEYQDTKLGRTYGIARGLSDRSAEPVRSLGTSRPVDLQVARLRYSKHPRFRARLPQAKVITLDLNYRSTKKHSVRGQPSDCPQPASASPRTCARKIPPAIR